MEKVMNKEEISFYFGKNWQDFMQKHYSDERVRISQKHILDFLGAKDLRGYYFLDIGCGSGLQSLSAFRSGAERIVSFDADEHSVQTTEYIKNNKADAQNWTVRHGSILDKNFIAGIEPADIVYSWGVLHHTGDMWTAIRNAAGLVKDGGLFYIALYTTDFESEYWLEVKKRYNRSGNFGKKWMEAKYIIRRLLIPHLLKLKNPLKVVKDYQKNRGMSYFHDVRDWLGGYPYEFARPEEAILFCQNELGLKLINLKTGEANTEYLFKKPD